MLVDVEPQYEGVLEAYLDRYPGVELVLDPDADDEEVPYYTPEDYVVVRCAPGIDADAFAGELARQKRTMLNIVGVFARAR